MANAFGIDLGEVYRTSEAIKSSKQRRNLLAKEDQLRDEDRASARERGATLNSLRSKAVTGDKQAMRGLISFDPKEAEAVMDALSKMSTEQREQMKENVETLGRISAYIMNSPNPEQAYQRARLNVSPDIAKNMPEQYDPNFVQLGLARARELDDMLANPDKITFGNEDRLYKDGRMVESATSSQELDRQNKLRTGGSGGGTKSADESLMYRQAAELLGGLFDQQGNLQNLDPNTRGKVQAIATEAAKLYTEGGRTRSQSVTEAARKLGIEIKNLGQQGGTDRNELLKMYSQ